MVRAQRIQQRLRQALRTATIERRGRGILFARLSRRTAGWQAGGRAASDRSWETHGRTVARLVQAELRSHSANFESREYRITSVGPYDDGAVSVWMQVLRAGVPVGNSVVRVAQPDGDPATLAARLAGQLVSSDVADWEIISHQDYPADLTRPSSPKP